MKPLYFRLFSFIMLVIFEGSCTSDPGNPEDVQQQTLGAFASKAMLLSLPAEEQKQAWIAKLETYSQLDLSLAQKDAVKKILSDLKELEIGKFYLSRNLREDAIAMAKITPQDDFIKLFRDATVSPPILTKTGPICDVCINDLENDVNPDKNYEGNITLRTPDCNCSWTCQQQADNMLCDPGQQPTILPSCQGGQTERCCNATAHGCGLFLLQSCDGYVQCLSN